MSYQTPIQLLPNLISGCSLYVKRDDLLPFSFGGNKYRIASELFKDMYTKGCNCIIGYGNKRSNLSRVIANLAFADGVPCYIVSPIRDDDPIQTTNNGLLVDLCNAKVRTCRVPDVADTVEAVFEECKSRGLKPYYINGNKYGCGNESTLLNAYSLAYNELVNQAQSLDLHFDYIFLATGTGMTQGGLIAGKVKASGDEKIVGISISRESSQEEKVIKRMLENSGIDIGITREAINVVDSYLCGGYGLFDEIVKQTIDDIYEVFGIPLDPVYTGKAFAGMNKYIKEQKINGNVLFIHTGGTPLFFDYLYNRFLLK